MRHHGAFFYAIIRDPARALSLAGLTRLPVSPLWGHLSGQRHGDVAQFWRSLLPISHYVELQIGQTNYGQPLTAALPQLGALLLFLLPLLLVVHRYRTPSGAALPHEESRP